LSIELKNSSRVPPLGIRIRRLILEPGAFERLTSEQLELGGDAPWSRFLIFIGHAETSFFMDGDGL
jgi:hypothetical protein